MTFKYKVLVIITPAVFFLDQLTKWLIRTKLAINDAIPVIHGYFDVVHIANKGAAFGAFAEAGSSFRTPFFNIVAIIAVIIIVISFIMLSEQEKMLAVVFSLVLGGIAGNMLDRVRFGEVTDFLSFHIHDKVADFIAFGRDISFKWEWPAFNVADSAITIAMVLLFWGLVKRHRNEEKARKK